MKRLLSLAISAILSMTILVGCSNDNSNTDDSNKKNIETTNDNSKEKKGIQL